MIDNQNANDLNK